VQRRPRTSPPRGISHAVSFWLLAILLGLFLFAATAPSPLYPVYAAKWGFSSITITAIYAVYASGALLGVLLTGRLSDHVGRRPVTAAALVVQIAGMAAFILADGVAWLYAGRILQGVATGTATGAISAWLLDVGPPQNPRFGGLVAGSALLAGLGSGGLGSALLVEYAPNPLRLIYWMLATGYALSLALISFFPDVLKRAPGALRSMRPRIGVPPSARPTFAAVTPTLIATWALGGLYAALGPSLAVALQRSESRLAGGLVIAALLGTGAAASALVRRVDPRVLLVRGSFVLILGVAATLVAVAVESVGGLYAASLVAGLGFGPAFSGVVRSLAPVAPPEKRGALLGAMYIVLYASFSVPTVLAGVAVARFPLRQTTYVYGLAVIALATVTTIAVFRRRRTSPVSG
jgi:MFS family permease